MSAMHQPAFQQHRRVRSLGGSSSIIRSDRDEDLALFHEMQERELASSTTQTDPSPLVESQSKMVSEDIFSSTEWDKNDYAWLLPAPSTPFFSSREQEAVGNGYSLNGMTSAKSLLKTSKHGISRSEPPSRAESVSRIVRGSIHTNQPAHGMAILRSSANGPRRALSSSIDATPRSSTPTSNGRPSTPKSQTAARPSTPTRGAAVPPSSTLGSLAKSVRPSTPTGRSAMISAASSSGPSIVRSASVSGPMQPTRAPPASASRPGGSSSRASTPVKRPATPTRTSNPPTATVQPSTVNRRSASPQPKNAAAPRPSSPAGRPRQAAADRPAVIPGLSEEPPPNLRTSISERPLSNSRGSIASRASGPRPAQPAEANDAARRLRLSGSPIRGGRLTSDSINSEKSVGRGKPHDAALQAALSNGIQSKMIDRTGSVKKSLVVAEKLSAAAISQVKKPVKSSPLREVKSTTPSVRESTGFGRNLSKRSLDMALRHMDIGKPGPTSFKSFMLNVPTSSLYSVRSSNGRGRSSSSIADSPMATSSNASSEHSMNFAIDRECSEGGDELLSERGSKASSTSQPDSYDEKKVNSWLGGPSASHSLESNADILQAFEQGLENLSTSESPLVSHCEGRMERNNFALEPAD